MKLIPPRIPNPEQAERLRRLRLHANSADAEPPSWDDIKLAMSFMAIDLDDTGDFELPVIEHSENSDTVGTAELFDNVTIEAGAIRVVDAKSFPLLRFHFTSTGPAEPLQVVFVGTPLVLDGMRRLLRDSVRLAVRHANEAPL